MLLLLSRAFKTKTVDQYRRLLLRMAQQLIE
jgi:hypothetical protein